MNSSEENHQTSIQPDIVPFVQVPQELRKNKEISSRSKGIWMYLAGCHPNSKLRLSTLHNFVYEGRDATQKCINELIATGYISKTANKGSNGKIIGWTVRVHHVPIKPKSSTKTQLPDNAVTGKAGEQKNKNIKASKNKKKGKSPSSTSLSKSKNSTAESLQQKKQPKTITLEEAPWWKYDYSSYQPRKFETQEQLEKGLLDRYQIIESAMDVCGESDLKAYGAWIKKFNTAIMHGKTVEQVITLAEHVLRKVWAEDNQGELKNVAARINVELDTALGQR